MSTKDRIARYLAEGNLQLAAELLDAQFEYALHNRDRKWQRGATGLDWLEKVLSGLLACGPGIRENVHALSAYSWAAGIALAQWQLHGHVLDIDAANGLSVQEVIEEKLLLGDGFWYAPWALRGYSKAVDAMLAAA